MMAISRAVAGLSLLLTLFIGGAALAEDEPQGETETTPFAGSEIILSLKDEKVVMTWEGETIATADVIRFKLATKLEGVPVAVFGTSDFTSQPGTACLGNIVVWKETAQPFRHAVVDPACGDDTEPSVDETGVMYFVPNVGPGTDTKPIWAWIPRHGMLLHALASYAPDPGTGWQDIKQDEFNRIADLLHNEEVYHAAQALLGDRLDEVVGALRVGITQQTALPSGVIYGTGSRDVDSDELADALMAVDPEARALYFALKTDAGVDMWPPEAEWPAGLADVVKTSIGTR